MPAMGIDVEFQEANNENCGFIHEDVTYSDSLFM